MFLKITGLAFGHDICASFYLIIPFHSVIDILKSITTFFITVGTG